MVNSENVVKTSTLDLIHAARLRSEDKPPTILRNRPLTPRLASTLERSSNLPQPPPKPLVK